MSSGAKLQTPARSLCKMYNFRSTPRLKTVIRSTFQIYNYVQGFGEDMLQRSLPLEHTDEKSKRTFIEFVDRYDILNYLGHHICGPSLAVFEHSELDNIVRSITTEMSK